jgi:hypothetical protein
LLEPHHGEAGAIGWGEPEQRRGKLLDGLIVDRFARIGASSGASARTGACRRARDTGKCARQSGIVTCVVTSALAERTNQVFRLAASEIATIRVDAIPGEPFTSTVPIEGRSYRLELAPHSVRVPGFQVLHQIEGGELVPVDRSLLAMTGIAPDGITPMVRWRYDEQEPRIVGDESDV